MAQFFSYAPGKAPAGKQGQQVTIKPGQHLAYKPGQGYYAAQNAAAAKRQAVAPPPIPLVSENGRPTAPPGVYRPAVAPPPVAPRPPVAPSPYAATPAATIDAQAGAQAQAGLTPQQDEVRRQQALTAAQAVAQEQAIQGFQTAASGLMQNIGPQVGAGYQDAAQTEGQMGAQVGGQVGQDLAAKEAASLSSEAAQGQTGGSTIDSSKVAQTMQYLNGVIPSDSMAQQGAAQQAFAAEQSALPLDAGREQLDARMAQARTDNDQYAQQLIHLAAQFPGLKAQALQQLNQYELDKANYRQSVRMNTENIKTTDANIANSKADNARQDRITAENIKSTDASIANAAADNRRQQEALDANIKAAGLDSKQKQANIDAEFKYKYASLQLRSKQDAAKAALAKKTIDVSASRLVGHIVYKDGSQDASIPVKQTVAKTDNQKAVVNRSKAVQSARTHAATFALKTMGKPVVSKGGKGRYVADPSQKYNVPGGVFPPAFPGDAATTNDPSRALRSGGSASSYKQAQDQVYQEIGGQSLEDRYGLSHEQVLAYVNSALAAAGWKKKG